MINDVNCIFNINNMVRIITKNMKNIMKLKLIDLKKYMRYYKYSDTNYDNET